MGLLGPGLQGLLSFKSRDAVLGGGRSCRLARTNASHSKAHLKVLCAVAPSFRLYRFGKLEDVQTPAFLSAHTGLDDCAASFIPPLRGDHTEWLA